MLRTTRTVRFSPVPGRLRREDVISVVEAVHVVSTQAGSWSVHKTGRRRVQQKFETRAAAVEFARKIAASRGVELIIHNPDGHLVRDGVNQGRKLARAQGL